MIHKPGIYFDMPEAEYHADESLSASGVKNLLVSPLTFWTRSNLNPNRRDNDTPAMAFGRACDKLIVEGPEAFSDAYAVRPEMPDDAIDGVEALRAKCAELGLKKGGSIAELCERIHAVEPDAKLWARLMTAWSIEHHGQEIISAAWYRDVVNRAQLVRNNQDVAKAFSGGYPQVSIFWMKNGVRRKARVDYLKSQAGIDLKTFSNPFDMPIDDAVARAMASRRYPIQATVYMDGIETIKQIVRDAPSAPVFGEVDGHWMDAFLACDEHRFGFVFVESGDVPNVRARWFDRRLPNGHTTAAFQDASDKYEWAVDQFRLWSERCGRAPWTESDGWRSFEDHEFPAYMVA